MIYKLNLKENTYSKENISKFVRTLKSSLSHYVDNIDDIIDTETGFSFDIIYDTTIDKKIHIEITDEYDKYGFTPLEFNIYIDGEEFGPMCYSSIEAATRHTKDFILSKLDNLFNSNKIAQLEEAMSGSLDNFLKSKVITVNSVTGLDPTRMKRSLMPRGCYFTSSVLLGGRVVDHGTIHWQGTDYVFRVKPDGTIVTMTDTQAGSNWSETIFKEALERDNDQEKDLSEFAYKIDDLKQFYNTATGIDRNKYPNFFAWFDDMKKSGKLNSMQLSN